MAHTVSGGEASQGKLLNFASFQHRTSFVGCQPHSNPVGTFIFLCRIPIFLICRASRILNARTQGGGEVFISD